MADNITATLGHADGGAECIAHDKAIVALVNNPRWICLAICGRQRRFNGNWQSQQIARRRYQRTVSTHLWQAQSIAAAGECGDGARPITSLMLVIERTLGPVARTPEASEGSRPLSVGYTSATALATGLQKRYSLAAESIYIQLARNACGPLAAYFARFGSALFADALNAAAARISC